MLFFFFFFPFFSLNRKDMAGLSNLFKSSLNYPEKYDTMEEQHSTQHGKQITCRDADFIEKLQHTAASCNDRKRERDLFLYCSQ